MAKLGIILNTLFSQIYVKITRYPIITITFLQLACICIAFNKFIFHPNDFMFLNVFDGLKNYYTLIQYVTQEPSPMGLWHFTNLNYPFGDYIFFTDNTPFLALILRFINIYICDISLYVVPFHNYFFLFFHLILPIFVYKLIRPSENRLIIPIILIAIGASWVNPQLHKLLAGVSNLSIALFSVFVMFILKDIFRIGIKKENISFPVLCLKIYLLIFLTGFFHLYYIPVLSLPILIVTSSILVFKLFKRDWTSVVKSITLLISVLLGGLSMKFFISSIDTYSNLRNVGAEGFGYGYWSFTPESIITPNPFNNIVPFIKSCLAGPISPESQTFVGNFLFYNYFIGLVFIISYILINNLNLKDVFDKIMIYKSSLLLVVTAFIIYATAAGVYVSFCFIPFSTNNWFSVFYLFYDKFKTITQFRCVGRFTFPGFWILFFLGIQLFYKYHYALSVHYRKIGNIITVVLVLIMLSDTFDFIKYQNRSYGENQYKKELIDKEFADLKKIDFTKYQAIYTIPAVIVGSENYDITLNDRAAWTTYWTRLSIYSGLPLFNSIISRTALNQANAQFNIPYKQTIDSLILNKLTDKKILVIYWPDYEKNYDVQITDNAKPAALNGSKIITKFKMDSITNLRDIIYYEWDVSQYH